LSRSNSGGAAWVTVVQRTINIEIRVNKPVWHSDDRTPRQLRQLCPGLKGYLTGGFARDLDGTRQRKQQHLVRVKIGALATSGKADRRI